MACSRWLTSGVSRISCLSLVERNGSDEATKSTSLPGSSILMATVCSSSESVGEPATICWNRVRTLRCNASISGDDSGSASGIGSTLARRNGVSWVKSCSLPRVYAGFPLRHNQYRFLLAQRVDQLNGALAAHG